MKKDYKAMFIKERFAVIAPKLYYCVNQISKHSPVRIDVYYGNTCVGEKTFYFRNELRHRGIRGLFMDAAAKVVGERMTKGIPGHDIRTVNRMVSTIKQAADYGDAHSRDIAELIRSLLTDCIDYCCVIVDDKTHRCRTARIRVDLNFTDDSELPKGVFYTCRSVAEFEELQRQGNGKGFYITIVQSVG